MKHNSLMMLCFLQRLTETIHKNSATLERDAEYTKSVRSNMNYFYIKLIRVQLCEACTSILA